MTRDSKQSQIEFSGATRGHLVAQKHPQSKKDSQRDSQTALQAAWCSNTRQRAHPQTQIAGRHVHEQPFENIAVPAQMSPAHPTRVVEASIGSLQQLDMGTAGVDNDSGFGLIQANTAVAAASVVARNYVEAPSSS